MKTYFRPPGKVPLNILNNLELLNIDYANDFVGDLYNFRHSYYVNYIMMRLKCLAESLFDLSIMMMIITITSYMLKKMFYVTFEESQ